MGLHVDGKVEIGDETYLQWYDSSEWGMRGFCKECGTNMFWSMKDRSMVVPFAGSLDDTEGLTFTEEIFIDEKPDYYRFGDSTKQKTGAEVFAQFS